MENTANSVQCLQHFYRDLTEFKKSPDYRFKYFDTYNCIRQPDEQHYAKIKSGPASFFKDIDNQLWKLYNDCYAKNAEIIAYVRLEDYKTDLEKGFKLVREMQQLQIAMGAARDKIAEKVSKDSKAMTGAGAFVKPYQLIMNAIIHEEDLIRKLSQNFNEDRFIGYPKEELLKSYLEMDELLKPLTTNKFSLPYPASSYFKSTIEGLQEIQKTKAYSLDNFNNTSTFDAEYTNRLYDNLCNYFNNDILQFYSNFAAQGRLNYYPAALREYDFDAPAVEWPLPNVSYMPPLLDSATVTKQAGTLTKAAFTQLNNITYYVDECVRSMENVFSALRYEETWTDIREKKFPRKNPLFKFDKVFVPLSLHGMIVKDSKDLPAPYRKVIIDQVNDVESTLLAIQENLMDLSKYLSRGDFRNGNVEFVDAKLNTVEMLYTELDLRKERLFMQIRKVATAYAPIKTNAWTNSAAALLRATDHSRFILQQMENKVYKGDESTISTAAIHEDQRDLIANQFTYMKGIIRVGRNNGLDPYVPYDYIPGYLKTLEEKITDLKPVITDKNKAYGDILYMHNIIVEQFNKFAELGLGADDDFNDPMTPVYILSYIRQPPKYHHEIPKPKEPEKTPEPEPTTELVVADVPREPISFEGYAYNNLVLLLDVSGSMNKPERLPLLKESFQQLVKFMRKEDEVSIVIYSGKAKVHLPPQSASDTTTIIRAIQSLRSDGVTNIADGLSLAYKTANKNFIKEGNNRIIVATDGEFKVNEDLFKIVEKNSGKIVLSVFDFSQLPDPLKSIQQLAEKGNGNYVKVTPENSLGVLADEARKINQ